MGNIYKVYIMCQAILLASSVLTRLILIVIFLTKLV